MTGQARMFDSRTDSLNGHPGAIAARKREQVLAVRFARTAEQVATLEGPVPAAPGDAIVTGPAGERWPVAPDRFASKYAPVPPCRMHEDGLYRSLPLPVLALQVDTAFTVVLPDGATRLQGQPGDWVVDHGDASLGIVAQALFARLYAAAGAGGQP